METLSEAYVIGLLADLEAQLPQAQKELVSARDKAARIDTELSQLLRRLDDLNTSLAAHKRSIDAASTVIGDRNGRVATLHQELATLKRKIGDLETEMNRVGPGAIYSRLRRDRARLKVQVDDREAELVKHDAAVTKARAELTQAEAATTADKDKRRLLIRELDGLQAQLPSPSLYVKLFELTAARAHCRLFLDGENNTWHTDLRRAIAYSVELHKELRLGKYRLDKNSDVIGGRATATAEALYGAVALGEDALARDLFALATDPALLFDQIFNVLRVFLLGFYLKGDHHELTPLLERHQFDQGLRGAYVRCFRGLLLRDATMVNAGLKALVKHEWEGWQDARRVRGAGVVNLGAAAIVRLGRDIGLAVAVTALTVPETVTSAASRARARRG